MIRERTVGLDDDDEDDDEHEKTNAGPAPILEVIPYHPAPVAKPGGGVI